MDFSDRRVLVTGGTRGIGRAAVEAYLEAGARVAVNGSTGESVARALREIGAGDRAVAAPGNVARVEDCRKIVETAVSALGGLDVLVNNAGISPPKKLVEDVTEEDWQTALDINLRAVFFCTKFAIPALRASQGNIVNIASILGLGGRAGGLSLYCASKGGVVNLTRVLAVELAPEIRVNCICPGAIDTDMLRDFGREVGQGDVGRGYAIITANRPIGRVAEPREIADPILYLSSGLVSFVTGSIHIVDGGVMAKAG